MRVTLRKPKSGLYFRDIEAWTADRNLARDFHRTVEAIAFATQHKLSGLEVVLLFDNPEHDLVVGQT